MPWRGDSMHEDTGIREQGLGRNRRKVCSPLHKSEGNRLLDDGTLGVGLVLGGQPNGLGGAGGQFCLLDTAEKDVAELICGFVVETEVGILFHDIECVAEFVGEFRFRCADRHDSIVAGRSIGFLGLLFHRGTQGRYPEPNKQVVIESVVPFRRGWRFMGSALRCCEL